MASTLPDNPSLDRLRDNARKLQHCVTTTDPGALEAVRRHHPRPDIALANAPERFALHDAQLTVALNLDGVPGDQLARDHVLANLEIGSEFASVTPSGFAPRAQLQPAFNPRDASDLEGATHFLTLKVSRLSVKSANVSVLLRNRLPKWCLEATTEDDHDTAQERIPPRTFGFWPIVSGAFRAVGGDPVFQFQLTLER